MLEPCNKKETSVPNIMLIPLIAYDENKNRLGYGGGFYDRYLNEYLKKIKKFNNRCCFFISKTSQNPLFNNDVKLKYILTEKGIF